MSQTVDNRVVEMEFDNSKFESNVQESLGTLDKLKQALNMDGAAKGFEDINSAVNNVNMNGLDGAVQTVKASFSALEVVAITALVNITNKAIEAGVQLVKSLTVDQISAGWSKFEENTKNVATLLSQGFDKNEVLEQTEKLLFYTDETSYSYTDMIGAISQFTAAGQGLDDSVEAMMGIANWAALSGKNAQTATNAMNVMAKAVGSGAVSLNQWQSIERMTMNTTEFMQKCLDAGVAVGTLNDNLDGTYTAIANGKSFDIGSFSSQLTKGAWLTSDVLMSVFKDYSSAVDQIYEYTEEHGGTASEAIVALGDDLDAFGVKAFEAGQKARSWGDVVGSLKDAASTKWMNIFTAIIGDADEASEVWTNLSDVLYGVTVDPVDSLMRTVKEAMQMTTGETATNPFQELIDGYDALGESTETTNGELVDYDELMQAIIRGDYGNGEERLKRLTEAGYDYGYAQNKVNEELGDSTRHETEYVEGLAAMTAAQKETIEQLAAMSDAEILAKGYSEEFVSELREAQKAADDLNMALGDYIETLKDTDITESMTGRELLLEGLGNVGNYVLEIFDAIGQAWHNVFNSTTSEELFDIVQRFHDWSEGLLDCDETMEKVTGTFQGLFSILDIGKNVISEIVNLGFRVLKEILDLLGIDILDITSNVGGAISSFHEWLIESGRLHDAFEFVGDKIIQLIDKVAELINKFLELPAVTNVVESFKTKLEELKEVGVNAIEGLKEGIESGELTIPGILTRIGEAIISAIKTVLGIHSPSTVMITIGAAIAAGLLLGMTTGFEPIIQAVQDLAQNIINAIGNIDWDKVLGVAVFASVIYTINHLFDTLNNAIQLGNSFNTLCTTLNTIGTKVATAVETLTKSIDGALSGLKFELYTQGIYNIVKALAVLAATVIVLGHVDIGTIIKGIAEVGVLAGVLIGVSIAFEKLAGSSVSVSKAGLSIQSAIPSLIGIGTALLELAVVIKLLEGIEWSTIGKAAAAMVEFLGFVAALGAIEKYLPLSTVNHLGSTMMALSTTLLLMDAAIGLAGMLDGNAIINGGTVIMEFLSFLLGIGLIEKYLPLDSINGIGSTMIALSSCLIIIDAAIGLAGMLDLNALINGGIVITEFLTFLLGIGLIEEYLPLNKVTGIGSTMLALSTALIAMDAAIMLAGGISLDAVVKSVAVMGEFLGFMAAVIAINNVASEREIIKVGSTMLALSTALGIMAIVVALIGQLDIATISKGITAVGLLSIFMDGMMVAASFIDNANGAKSIQQMGIAIGILSVCVAGLSFISPERLYPALTAVSILMTIFALVEAAGSNIKTSPVTLGVMYAGIAVLAAVIALLSNIDSKSALASATALSEVMIALAAAFAIIESSSKSTDWASLAATMVLLGEIIIACTAALEELSNCPAKGMVAQATALSETMVALAAAVAVMETFGKGYDMASLVPTMVLLGEVVIACTAAMKELAECPSEGMVVKATALSETMVALAAALAIIESSSKETDWTSLVSKMVLLGEIIVACTAALEVLADCPAEGMITKATALSEVMLALSAAMAIIGSVKDISADVELTVITLGLILGEISGLLIIMSEMEVENALVNATALSEVLLAMSGAVFILSYIGPAASSGVLAIAELSALIGAIGVVITAIGALNEYLEGDLRKFLDSGLDLLIRLGEGLGEFVGTIISSFLTSATSGLGDVANNLSTFMQNLQPFIDGVNDLPDNMLGKVSQLVAVMAELTGENVISKVLDIFTGGQATNFAAFGENLVGLGEAFTNFGKSIEGIDTETLSAVATMTEALADLENGLPKKGGTLDSFLGETESFEDFGNGLESFGESMHKFSESITGENAIDPEAITAAATAAGALSELEAGLPSHGGVLQDWLGDDDLESFGNRLESFGTALVKYSDTVKGDAISADAIQASVNAASILSEFEAGLPSHGGIVAEWFMGDASLESFGEELGVFGQAMVDYSDLMSDNPPDETAIQASVDAATILSDFEASLPEQSGVIAQWFLGGSQSLSQFGDQLRDFGSGIMAYANNVRGITEDDVNRAGFVAEIAQKLAELDLGESSGFLGKIMGGQMSFKEFGSNLKSFGSAFADFAKSIEGIGDMSRINDAVAAIENIVALCNKLEGVDTSVLTTFGTNMKNLAKSGIDDFVNAFEKADKEASSAVSAFIEAVKPSEADAATFEQSFTELVNQALQGLQGRDAEFQAIGESYMSSFISGLQSQDSNVVSAFNTLIESVLSQINGRGNSFSIAGMTLVTKFTQGAKSRQNVAVSTFNSIITECMNVLTNEYDTFNTIGITLMENLISGVTSKQSEFTDLIQTIIDTVITYLESKYPTFEEVGVTYMSNLINGVRSKQQEVIDAFTAVVDAAYNAIHSTEYYNKFEQTGEYFCEGVAAGIDNKAGDVYQAVKRLADGMISELEKDLAEASPSKITTRDGQYFGQGLVNGIEDYYTKVGSASSGLGESAINGLESVISQISELVEDSLDSEPVIRPVLDLTELQEGIGTINTMFGRSQALAIGSGFAAREVEGEIQNDSNRSGNTYQFTQNNYSPKSLSRTEIYRQTKNQFAAAQRRLESQT